MPDADDPRADAGADRGADRGAEIGSEIAKLVAAVQEWARKALPESSIGHGGPECQWCPICQFVNVVRGESPEVGERVAEAGAAVAAAVRALADAAVTRAQREPGERPRPGPRLQRIDLDDGRES
jgi:hypothetical protein